MVDDQNETYTVELLEKLKANHEKWVSSSLAEEQRLPPVVLRRIKHEIPSHLVRLTSGRDVIKIVDNASAYSFDHDEPQSEAEVEAIKGFLQEAQDWGDLSGEFEAAERVTAAFRMTALLRDLEEAGFWVFGARETQRLEGGVGPPSSFPVAIVQVIRSTNPEIVKVDLRGLDPPTDSS